MINPLVKNNIEILKKIRLLNIEVNKLIYTNLQSDEDESGYMLSKKELENKRDLLSVDIKDIEQSIEAENKNINDIGQEIDDLLKSKKNVKNIDSEEIQEKLDILDLRIKLSKKKENEYKSQLDDLNAKFNDVCSELDFLEKTYNKEVAILSDKSKQQSEKFIELNKTINYTLDLLNNNIRSKYENIMYFIKKMWNGFPVGVIVDGFCENCNIKVCLQREIDILNMNKFVMCDMCGCFLVDVIKNKES
jgi:predicted  nucleic acid-binding Zn-ribbon protein